ncbi:MAG: transposase [Rheinheimera sp.]|nr:transposase [Rheinheimera sp.]
MTTDTRSDNPPYLPKSLTLTFLQPQLKSLTRQGLSGSSDMAHARKKQVSVDTTPSYHVVSRCVRRTFLFGSFENKDFSHRRQLIVERLAELAKVFCIAISAFAIMSNHYHLVVRIQKQQALDLDVHDVVRRWNALFRLPVLVERFTQEIPMSSAETAAAHTIIATWRSRLYDLSWFMRCLNEHIARIANAEDQCTGRFWEGRFKSQALLDEKSRTASDGIC